ncbi:MAG: circularly permuted type 2 ATP-grasp protein [Deltaproteobacteria bacterium]|nr:circularly permuted type 2 ATP-grasp protein [Deltaproteobacteria bacterium]MCB9488078.1 circularly permuted type 2 ATP-grasp protein [Deltaproteobacteria bacterium]
MFTKSYPLIERTYDELFDAPDHIRPHWQGFADVLERIGDDELDRRWERARRLIHEHGVTYNLFGDPDGMERPWDLDPLPNLLAPDSWSLLEPAVAQRARLLNAVLVDLYGEQTLLKERLLPPELVFANPSFQLACHGMRPPADTWMHLYAADFYRREDGSWNVVADRTETPSGIGYLLENRIIVSHALPDFFHELHVRRLATFYVALKRYLNDLAPRSEHPNIVLLTPGPHSPTYFEHSYLSRYLGYTLAEAGDLTVRDNAVFLKTLNGLLAVDVILRRVADRDCDPLAIQSQTTDGVPGLLSAMRAGNVLIANAVGCSAVESSALMPFLPSLCRHLLSEELLVPSVRTWWCGDPEACAYVVENLDTLVLRPAFSAGSEDAIGGGEMSKKDKAQAIAQIKAHPHRWVARERLELSTMPAWQGHSEIAMRRMLLRMYGVASAEGYEVLPGGLTRVAAKTGHLLSATGNRGGSKDTWITSTTPVPQVTLLPTDDSELPIVRGLDLPSRVADNLFWLGRYVERTESLLRLLRAISERMSEQSTIEEAPEMAALLGAVERTGVTPAGSLTKLMPNRMQLETQVLAALFDPKMPGSLIATIKQIHRTASLVRDRLSLDTWRVISRLESEFLKPAGTTPTLSFAAAVDQLNELAVTLSAFAGVAMETMTRGLGWRFLDTGRRLERAAHTANLLRGMVQMQDTNASDVLEAILEVAASSMTYRARYRTTMHPALVLDLLLIDETNPRSVAFQLAVMERHMLEFPREKRTRPHEAPEERLILRVLTNIRLADAVALNSLGQSGGREALAAMLRDLDRTLPAISDQLTQRYLVLVDVPRQLASESKGGAGS